MNGLEVTVGIGGAAGDGNAATGDTLAKVCARLGLHIYVYNAINRSSVAGMCGFGCVSLKRRWSVTVIIST